MSQIPLRVISCFTLTTLLLATGCSTQAPAPPAQPPASSASTPQRAAAPKIPGVTRHKAPGRLVAIGDIHGDLKAALTALRLAGAIDDRDTWIGGDLVVVQTGDLLDRGDDEQTIIDLLEALRLQAREAGGALIVLNGNHEIMNVQGDLRYVTPGGFEDFKDAQGVNADDPTLAAIPEKARARMAAFAPGRPYALKLADHDTIAIVEDTVFVHGGVLPEHVRYGVDKLNDETSAWMRGERRALPDVMRGDSSPIWSRHYSSEPVDDADCALLRQTLDLLGAQRMVVGHTVQKRGITSACEGCIWRIDTGMSAHYGGQPQALEITPSGPKILQRDDTAAP
ncbi:MAG: calcineurin [Myxococcales bacterium]|nr:calcineurin [Myxococcales bacterium]